MESKSQIQEQEEKKQIEEKGAEGQEEKKNVGPEQEEEKKQGTSGPKIEVSLKTKDEVEIKVDSEVAKQSVFIKGVIDDSGTDEVIPLPSVEAKVLKKILEYCEHICTHPPPQIDKPLKSIKLDELTSKYYADFIDFSDKNDLFDIVIAANYLDIASLVGLGCAKIASKVKDRPIQEAREFFDIENDFTPEEEEQIEKECAWAKEAF